jgi:exopolysaccharide biosynthesis polyprenyl glycosylphosphotransferase
MRDILYGRPGSALEARPKTPRRRVLFLSGGRNIVEDITAFLTASLSCQVIPCIVTAGDGSASAPPGGEHQPGQVREAAFALVRQHGITDVAVEWPSSAAVELRDEICDCLLSLKVQGVRVHELSHFCERIAGRLPLLHEAVQGLISGSEYHFSRRWKRTKRLVDVLGAGCLLLLTWPLFFLAAAAIAATSPGPVFYRQDRVGLNGRIFRIAKFRSMRVDAEKDGFARFAARNDDRITPVGRFLRRTRVDELPQLFNVLVGDMSLVGPRPERPIFVDGFKQSVPLYDLRHQVKPGITGWAQVKDAYAASETETRGKLSCDLYYIKKGSMWLDLRIMTQTVWVILTCQGSQ